MLIENIPRDRQNKLFMALDRNLSSLRKRSIAYTITCYSENTATVNIMVTGRRGTASKVVAIVYDTLLLSWVVYNENKKYTLVAFSEIATIFKSVVAALSTTMTKI